MNKTIRIIGVPLDLGQNKRGVDMGPSAIRYAGLSEQLKTLGYRLHDNGNLHVPVRDTLSCESCDEFRDSIQHVCQAAYDVAMKACEMEEIPLFLGGDHSLSIGTIGGVTSRESVGVIWVDAHADSNTPETSPSGNIHGMPVATLLGEGFPELVNIGRPGAKLSAEDVVMIALRDLDGGEKKFLKRKGIRAYTMHDLDKRGMAVVAREALDYLGGHSRLHLSLDMDGLDPDIAPGVGTPVSGGLSYREAQLLMEIVAESKKLASADIVEINPILDHRNHSAEIAVELTASLLGKSIL